MTMKSLLKTLINIDSVTPYDKGCQEVIALELQAQGFKTHSYNSGNVSNLWAEIGTGEPVLAFAGHTDVVPTGDLAEWHTPPFEATEKGDLLYGRGACDMKGAICAMIAASQRFLKSTPQFNGRLAYLITSGEEGDEFMDGTPYVMEQLAKQSCHIDYCIVGEPTSHQLAGDVIKVGRRGSLTAYVTVYGKQGHVAYPDQAINPIHHFAPLLTELDQLELDKGNEYFPPTSFQITNLNSGTGAGNVIPGELTFQCNFRYSTEVTAQQLQTKLTNTILAHHPTAKIDWKLNGQPFLTTKGKLINAAQAAIQQHQNFLPELSTSGGTSDGRFIAPYGGEVIELGVSNDSIHQINEYTSLPELEKLSQIYQRICEQLLK
jgi:succinyl-diaminopimelate desuccinylase